MKCECGWWPRTLSDLAIATHERREETRVGNTIIIHEEVWQVCPKCGAHELLESRGHKIEAPVRAA